MSESEPGKRAPHLEFLQAAVDYLVNEMAGLITDGVERKDRSPAKARGLAALVSNAASLVGQARDLMTADEAA